jgi:hypothetical protein
MHPRSHLIATSVVVALSGATLAGPAPALAGAPDGVQDWRAPDTIDAATAAAAAAGEPQDARSPDAVDAATASRSQPYVRVTSPPAITRSPAGFDWDSAAIGAGGAIGLMAISAGTGLALRRRRAEVPSRVA